MCCLCVFYQSIYLYLFAGPRKQWWDILNVWYLFYIWCVQRCTRSASIWLYTNSHIPSITFVPLHQQLQTCQSWEITDLNHLQYLHGFILVRMSFVSFTCSIPWPPRLLAESYKYTMSAKKKDNKNIHANDQLMQKIKHFCFTVTI